MNSANVGLLVLRLALGAVFLAHGVKHYRRRSGTMRWIEGMGFSNPMLQWFFMAFAEIGVGVSLILGLLTSIGIAGLIGLMAVAFWTVHRHAGFWITARPDEGWEYVFLLSAAGTALALLGPGEWSLDHAIGIAKDLDAWMGLILVAAGVVAAAVQLAAFYRPADNR
jgi:putative oxidoreductase